MQDQGRSIQRADNRFLGQAMIAWLACLAALLGGAGCRSSKPTYKPDPTIAREAKSAEAAYAEGSDREAIAHYTLALQRSWAIDDPLEIGHNAYNLAACLAAVGFDNEARDCLREARAELRRAGQSESAAWLLEAKIARSQGLPADAVMAVQMAEQTLPCFEQEHPRRACAEKCPLGCGVVHAAHEHCPGECPSPGPKPSKWAAKHKKQEDKHCRGCPDEDPESPCLDPARTAAAIHLLKAELACDQYDLPQARGELSLAQELIGTNMDAATRAQIERLNGRILLLEGQSFPAARRLDSEAYWLRRAKLYREIPSATGSAGEAYEAAGELLLASERYYRCARMLYARDEWLASLAMIDRSVALAVTVEDLDMQARAAFLFHLVDRAVQAAAAKQTKRPPAAQTPPPAPPAEPVPPPPVAPPGSPPPAPPSTFPPATAPGVTHPGAQRSPTSRPTTISDESISALRSWTLRRVEQVRTQQ